MGTFDSQNLSLQCPKCKRKTAKSVSWIKQHSEFTCACGSTIRLERDKLLAGLRKAEDAIGRLKKTTMKLKL